VCNCNPDPVSTPGRIQLPVEEDQIEAARETLRENKGAQWSVGVSSGIQVGDNVELRNNLIPLLIELDVPTATISDMFGLTGRELWNIAAAEPISVFRCRDCSVLLKVRDRRDLMRLIRAARAISCARAGDPGDVTLLCDSCTELRLQLHNEEQRLRRLASQARTAQLRKMPFAEYRVQSEWQARRSATQARAGHRCQTCGKNDVRLDVHHNTYERYGDESIFDLVVLCDRCHALFHGLAEDAS
jgi:5-methylcytosine-specific restriction endonuclease McrA